MIEIGYYPNDRYLAGLKFYDTDSALVMETGFNWLDESGCQSHTVHLEVGERVIGYKSRGDPENPGWGWHFDFQLIIGKLV